MAPTNLDYLQCRTIGHSWDPTTIPYQRNSVFGRHGTTGWRMTFRCTSCHTVRHDLIAPSTGELIQRQYDYPDGYHLARDETPSKDTYRRTYYLKVIKPKKP